MSTISQQLPETTIPQPQAPAYTLFDAQAIGLATFFGTPAAGATLMLVNDNRLGRSGHGATTLILAIAVTALVILVGWNIPQGFSAPIALLLVFAMRHIATAMQGTAVKDHMERGGLLGSKWRAFTVGMAYFVAIFGTAFFAVFLPAYKLDHGPKVVVGSKDEIYYSGSATQAEAVALGKDLKATGYLSDSGVTVMLDKGQDGTVVSFVVKEGIWDKPDMVASFDEIGREVAPVLGGFPIKVRLMDKNRNIKHESGVGKVDAGNDHIYYMGAASAAQAHALAEALKTAGFFGSKGADVFLSKQSDGTALSFVVGDGIWDDPAMIASFEKIARDVAPAIGGLPIRLRLENTSLEVKKDEALK